MIAVRMLQQGKGIREVSRWVGVFPTSVSRWNHTLKEQGAEALKAKSHPGKPSKLTAAQKEQLAEILRRGARAAGFPTELWTLKRVAQVIEQEFGGAIPPGVGLVPPSGDRIESAEARTASAGARQRDGPARRGVRWVTKLARAR
ncbi:MAG: helix-turn-helix domain-containing protein [Anaerolineae bacterium]